MGAGQQADADDYERECQKERINLIITPTEFGLDEECRTNPMIEWRQAT